MAQTLAPDEVAADKKTQLFDTFLLQQIDVESQINAMVANEPPLPTNPPSDEHVHAERRPTTPGLLTPTFMPDDAGLWDDTDVDQPTPGQQLQANDTSHFTASDGTEDNKSRSLWGNLCNGHLHFWGNLCNGHLHSDAGQPTSDDYHQEQRPMGKHIGRHRFSLSRLA